MKYMANEHEVVQVERVKIQWLPGFKSSIVNTKLYKHQTTCQAKEEQGSEQCIEYTYFTNPWCNVIWSSAGSVITVSEGMLKNFREPRNRN